MGLVFLGCLTACGASSSSTPAEGASLPCAVVLTP
jgi:hypothetical protein